MEHIIEEHYQFGNIGRGIICNKPAVNSPVGYRVSFRGKPLTCLETLPAAQAYLLGHMKVFLSLEAYHNNRLTNDYDWCYDRLNVLGLEKYRSL